jgi:hypothetical protein
MAALLTVGVIAGMLLGLRFKALALCPALIVVAFATAATGIATGHHIGSVVLDIGLVTTALQIGYFGGCIIRIPVPATGLFRRHHRSSPLGY